MSKGCSGVCGALHGATGPRESPRPLDPKVRLNRPAVGHNSLVTLKRRRKGTGSLRAPVSGCVSLPSEGRTRVKTARPAGPPLQRRLLALLDDHSTNGDQLTAAGLAEQVAAPVSEGEAELETPVLLGDLSRSTGTHGQGHYSPGPRRQPPGPML